MSTNIEVKNDIICISVTGECPKDVLDSTQLMGAKISKKENILKILVDLREASLDLNTSQLFELNRSHHFLFPVGTKHAVIISDKTGKPGDERFVENVAVNRGVMLKTFMDTDKAMEWLKE
jgi:hypothetical protein